MCIGFLSQAQNINIHIYEKYKIDTFLLTAHEYKYDIIANNEVLFSIQPNEYVKFTVRKNKIKISHKKHTIYTDKTVQIRGSRNECFFTISHPRGKIPKRDYDNDIYVSRVGSKLKIINDVNFEKYIAGVVEAEGGPGAPLEYFKTQAILCRTYSAKHYKKHLDEGFNLCDGVHCQAFNGRCKHNLKILDAALQTAGLVVVDSSRNLISATFYANSGGETVNSEDVWINALPYLRAVQDTFSVGMHGDVWIKKMPLNSWIKYLKSNGYSMQPYEEYKPYVVDTLVDSTFLIDTMRVFERFVNDTTWADSVRIDSVVNNDSVFVDTISVLFVESISQRIVIDTISPVSDTIWSYTQTIDTTYIVKSQKHYPIDFLFEQPKRKLYFDFRGCDTILPLKKIRLDLQLRSTFFNVKLEGNTIVLEGHGYGHGVGMSQEGAMKMANLNYTYDQIIKFYYTGVQIMSVRALNFFQIE